MKIRILIICLLSASYLSAQNPTIIGQTDTVRAVIASVPFAAFTPDARSAGLGDAGAALSPDANSVYWGAAKLANSKKDYGVAFSYTPWLRNLVDDMQFVYVSGFKKLSKSQAIGFGVMYFDHGKFESRNSTGVQTGDIYANEVYATAAYSRKMSEHFSMGLNLKYIYSNLAGGYVAAGSSIKPASTAAGDISMYYHNEKVDEGTGRGWDMAGALLLQNIGGKVNYGGTENGFIPTTFKLGGAATRHIDLHNKITFVLDVNKLMIPTPPVRDANKNIIRGKNPNISPISAIFSSWSDAPDGFKEEIKEFMISAGAEYWYNDLFALRLGYFNETRMKGDRKYFTIGFGARIQQRYGFDFAYLMPQKQGSPLANTLRFSVVIDMFKKQVDDVPTIEEEGK